LSFSGTTVSNAEAQLTRVVDGELENLFAGDEPDEGGLSVTIDSIESSGDELIVSGSFSTVMGASDSYGGGDIDLGDDPLTVSGDFDVVLGPVE
jgi:hypothetical protein